MNTKVKLLAAGYIAGLVLAATALLSAGEAGGLQQTSHAPSTNDFLVWDNIAKTTNVVADATDASFVFNFTNLTSGKIVITDVQTSCGCTTVEIPNLPWTIVSGTNGQIAVSVNITGEGGDISKTVFVDTDKGTETLTVNVTMLPATNQPVSQPR